MTPIPFLTPAIYDGIESLGLTADIRGWHSNLPFIAEMVERVKPKVYVEAGVFLGASLLRVASLAPDCKCYAIDTWIGGEDHTCEPVASESSVRRDRHGWPQLYYQFLHNVKSVGFQDRIVPIPMQTAHGAKLLAEHKVVADLCYVDAGHGTLDCLLDTEAYWPLVRSGGVMFGDDFERVSVQDAVKFFVSKNPGLKTEVSKDGNFWALTKP